MNTTDKVKQCRTPQEALLVLAAAIDELRAAPAADPWEQPLVWVPGADLEPPKPEERHLSLVPDNRARIVNGEVIVSPVSEERQAARRHLARANRFHEFLPALDPAAVHDAYVKGGPRWLCYTYRDAVMQMPMTYRRALVEDVLLDSPSEADEIGRDILKFDESVPEGAAIEAARRDYGPLDG